MEPPNQLHKEMDVPRGTILFCGREGSWPWRGENSAQLHAKSLNANLNAGNGAKEEIMLRILDGSDGTAGT
jgi:hypothetical protein